MTRIVGVDPSLTSTGVCVVNVTDERCTVAFESVTSSAPKRPADRKQPRTIQRVRRIRALRNAIVDLCRGADLVVIEAPTYSPSTSGAQHDRSGLWWTTVMSLDHLDIPLVEVSPTTVKKFATGKGNADKTSVAAALTRWWPSDLPGIDQPYGDDQFDALALASIGAVKLVGRLLPISILERHRMAIGDLDWPDVYVSMPGYSATVTPIR
jgi:Holliday junction resolvasome RuvABC endonuclease subunit